MSINGSNDRRCEALLAPARSRRLAASVAILFERRLLVSRSHGTWKVDAKPSGLKLTERFANQWRISDAFSGFLVGANLLLTTKHDVGRVENLCAAFVFELGTHVYTKQTILSRELFHVREIAGRNDLETGEDWLLLELDRSPQRPHVKVRSKPIEAGASVGMFGHPLGLPKKFSGGGTVTKEGDPVFECDLDASIGNSGSMVFSIVDGAVVGVMKATAPGVDLRQGLWLRCPTGARCATLVTSSCRFLPAIEAASF